MLAYVSIEHLLCQEGFGDLYEAALSQQQRAGLSAPPGEPDHWLEVAGALNSRQKTRLAAEVADEMRRGSRSVPPPLAAILDTVTRLSGG